jgi:hypothetical protein
MGEPGLPGSRGRVLGHLMTLIIEQVSRVRMMRLKFFVPLEHPHGRWEGMLQAKRQMGRLISSGKL